MTIIEVEHLHKRYGDLVAVEDVSLRVEEGEIFGVLGQNGAGKTTTVECIAGLRAADDGRIAVAGHDPRTDAEAVHAVVGVQLQEAALPDRLRVGEALELFASFYDDPADPGRLLDALALGGKRDARFSTLSGGQRQRLSIALALIGRPRVAILDELTTGLDPSARRDAWALVEQIREMGVTVVLVTHLMEEAERLCDRVAVIDRGRVVATGTPLELSGGTDAEQRLRLRPSGPLDDAVLEALPEVTSVHHTRDGLVVTGGREVLASVVAALDRHGLRAEELTVQRTSLEDAFLALTSGAATPTKEH